MPFFPPQSFKKWAAGQGLDKKPDTGDVPKVIYFAGCTANYFFPEVAMAAVAVMKAMGVSVWCPPQLCCGMPSYLEGDQRLMLKFAEENTKTLNAAVWPASWGSRKNSTIIPGHWEKT